MRGIMAGPTLLNVRHSPAGPSRLAGIASAGCLPPPLRPLPAVLPADHPKAPWPVSLPRLHRLAVFLRSTNPSFFLDRRLSDFLSQGTSGSGNHGKYYL